MVDAMLFEQRLWAGLADGSVRVTFRRWKRPRARAGGRHRTPAGVLAVDAVAEVDPAAISEDDARAAGFASLADLLRQLDRYAAGPARPGRPGRSLDRRCLAADRRPAGRAGRRSGRGRRPGAAGVKSDVRKLKELGLTESLEVGYRLSPRGRALLERLG
jgi:hypothetical protein